jgi:magnesium transporter
MNDSAAERDQRHMDRLNELALAHAHRDYAHVRATHTVAEALDAVRQSDVQSRIVYFYVLDEQGRLQGVVPTRRLLLSPPDARIGELMVKNTIVLPATASLLDACEMFIVHRLLALPIVDNERHVLGIIDVEEYTDEIRELDVREASNDVFQLIGVRLAQVQQASLPRHLAMRFPWLLCNIGGGLLCAVIAGIFENVLEQVILLALFIPVVLALAESVSIQSLTLTLQAQHGTRTNWRMVLASLRREFPVGVLLGILCGLLVGLAALLWQGQLAPAAVILLAITLSVATAALLGLLVPSVMMAFDRDPKVASGPITLAATDTLTMIYYLGLGTWWLL